MLLLFPAPALPLQEQEKEGEGGLRATLRRWVEWGRVNGCGGGEGGGEEEGGSRFEVLQRLLREGLARLEGQAGEDLSQEEARARLALWEKIWHSVTTSPVLAASDIPPPTWLRPPLASAPASASPCPSPLPSPKTSTNTDLKVTSTSISTTATERYDRAIFEAALAYYGLPKCWGRLFTLVPVLPPGKGSAQAPTKTDKDKDKDKDKGISLGIVKSNRGSKASNTTTTTSNVRLAMTTLLEASRANRPVWVQVNEPGHTLALARSQGGVYKKATIAEIRVVRNLTLDFEYPPHPALAHAVGVELAYWLVEEGLALPGLPVEDSGAGCHLVLPLRPIFTGPGEACGGPGRVNQAVRVVVERRMKPLFEGLADRYGLKGQMELEGFDLAHLLSAPGSWRPSTKRDDCPALREGYRRRWLPPHDRFPPRRKESTALTDLILDTAKELSHASTVPSPSFYPTAYLKPRRKPRPTPGSLRTNPRSTAPTPTYLGFRASRYARAAMWSEVARIRTAPVGQGNNVLNLAAFRLGQLVAIGWLEIGEVETELVAAATAGGRRSLPEARRTIASGLKGGLKAPRQVPR